ncbi:MAG TPA: hypothetical protein VK039_11325, partial [Brevibacterium sp.]|nr:hypothetical protein [Brevibacterium sp.]
MASGGDAAGYHSAPDPRVVSSQVTMGPGRASTSDTTRAADRASAGEVADEGDEAAAWTDGGEALEAVDQAEPEQADPEQAEPEEIGPEGELARIVARWDAILEVIRDGSRRHHAVFAPATPVRAGDGILTLRYGRRYASFHAANAAGGDYAAAMQRAVEQTCGLRVRLDVIIEGEDERRRPRPPAVTPDDARTPVFPD